MRRGLPWRTHLAHAMMSIFTGGLWLVVWWLHWRVSEPQRSGHWRLWS